MSSDVLHSALLSLIQSACESVLILVDQLPRETLMRSRLTRGEVQRQLATVVASVAQVGPEQRAAMPEIDWSGWALMQGRLAGAPGEARDEALWFACQSLVPATLLWLRVYQQSHPDLFHMTLA